VEARQAWKVPLELGSDIDDLTVAVKQMCTAELEGVDAVDLKVYAWNNDAELRPENLVAGVHGGDNSKCPIRVLALKCIQGMLT
jgi:hypothetical protein